MDPPTGVYFVALLSRLPKICWSRTGSPITVAGAGPSDMMRRWRLCSIRGRSVSAACSTARAKVHGLALQLDQAPADAGHVEEIVEQPRQVIGLAPDQAARPIVLRPGRLPVEHRQGIDDHAHGVAQLVGEHREELVLGLIGQPRLGQRGLLVPAGLLALGLEPLPLAHVAGDLGRAHDAAVAGPDGRDRQRDRDQVAVLGPALGLEVLDCLAAPEPADDLVFLEQALGRDDDGDRLADHLGLCVAEEHLSPPVP